MPDEGSTRRMFLQSAMAAGVGWAAVDLSEVEHALAYAAQQTAPGQSAAFQVLSPAEAAVVEAATARLLPAVDGRPGAREAGVVHFVDRALATFNQAGRKAYRDGVKDLNRRAARRWKGTTDFAALAIEQQDLVLRDIEKTPFFQALRFDTLVGTFALPTWGGNRDHAGWRLIGLDHQPVFQPPFGYYDADANRRG
jgi:gluconate 2-dehydrogenase gamma chain